MPPASFPPVSGLLSITCRAWALFGLAALAFLPAAHGAELSVISIVSSQDQTPQAARIYVPAGKTVPIPLVVVLHTWSGNYLQNGEVQPCLARCETQGWALVQPDFRGPNKRPQACASELAVADVLDAVAHMKKLALIDERRIWLVGTSGGGHMALMMASRSPHVWAGVSAWVPISDLAAWHAETKAAGRGYYKDVEQVCGGPPGASAAVDEQYRVRSPLSWLVAAKGLPIDINTGIHDGHAGSVPVRQSLRAFNVLAQANGHAERVLSDGQIEVLTAGQKIPDELKNEQVDEPGRKEAVLLRREAGPVRVTVFDGGHSGDMPTALNWLAKQARPGK